MEAEEHENGEGLVSSITYVTSGGREVGARWTRGGREVDARWTQKWHKGEGPIFQYVWINSKSEFLPMKTSSFDHANILSQELQ